MYEAFSFAVCARRIGLCSDVFQPQLFACFCEGFGLVAGAIVGHDALHGYTHMLIPGDGGLEMGDSTDRLFVGVYLAE